MLVNEPRDYKKHLHVTKKYLPDENYLYDSVELHVVSDVAFESLGQRPEELFDPVPTFGQVRYPQLLFRSSAIEVFKRGALLPLIKLNGFIETI